MIKIRPLLLATILLGLSLGFLTSPSMAAKDYYKWVDENGVTHYSARKPHGKESETISVSTGLPRDSNGQPVQLDESVSEEAENQASNSDGESQPTEEDPELNKDPQRCEVARNNLKILNEKARIREKTEDGSLRMLTEDEKNQRKQTAQQVIDEAC